MPVFLVVFVTSVKISLTYACGQEKVVQLGDLKRGLSRQADR